jgi:PTH1 family peptidyl-tRNA hydrolase
MKFIIGLGNPGEQYSKTRHNVGWLALDYLLGPVKWQENKKFAALVHEDPIFTYVKPLTFMNASGESARKILDFYGFLPKKLGLFGKKDLDLRENLIVIQDDLDIEFGKFKIAEDSSSAGHRGIQSIIDQLKTKRFTRIRFGIKNSYLKNPIPSDKFVLQNFMPDELNAMPKIFDQIKEVLKK